MVDKLVWPEFLAQNSLLVGVSGEYPTISAAISDWGAGDAIVVAAGTYAENITVIDGMRLIALGPVTVGTGAGAAVTIASPAGGEVATFSGPWTFSATAAIAATVGAHLSLTNEVVISGTVSGVYRRGRKFVLQSGEAIATSSRRTDR